MTDGFLGLGAPFLSSPQEERKTRFDFIEVFHIGASLLPLFSHELPILVLKGGEPVEVMD